MCTFIYNSRILDWLMTFTLYAAGSTTVIPNSHSKPASVTVYMYTFQLFTTLAMLFNVTFYICILMPALKIE
jgi:hypothetical protein